MTSRYSFRCTKCNKKFEITGHWWNQWTMHIFLDLKYIWHCIIHHQKGWNKKGVKYFLLCHLLFPVLVILDLLAIITYPISILWR